MKNWIKTGFLCTSISLLTAAPVNLSASDDPAELMAQLAGNYDVRLTSGRIISGELSELTDESMTLRQGNASFPFRINQIDRIRFPGTSLIESVEEYLAEGNPTAARRLLEAIARQRQPFLSKLTEDQLRPFVQLVDVYLQTDDEERALALIETIRPYLANPVVLQRLNENILTAMFQLGRDEEAAQLARDQILSQGRYGDSSLGFAILTEMHLNRGEAEQALWLALQPIVFSNDYPMTGLARIYGLALEATMSLKDQPQALALLTEMEERGLTWPPEDRFEPVRQWAEQMVEKLARQAGEQAEANQFDEGSFANHESIEPKEDLNLPLENIRRLLR